MILRMYELAAADVERLAGWPAEAGRYAGALRSAWPRDRWAIELAVATADAQGRQQTERERQATMRRLIPWLARRLFIAGPAASHALVIRLDGRLQTGGLVEAMPYLDPAHTGLFSFTGASRLSPTEPLPPASISLLGDLDVLADLCANPALSLVGGARLRAFAVPHELAPELLSCAEPEDERWPDLLPQASVFIGPSATMQSVFVIGPANAEELRQLLTVTESV
jgi:hypothetical protein